MPAWIEDAQILNNLKDIKKNRSSILQTNAEVDEFLDDNNLHSCALVAPKGFGKTLILKMKRVSLQADGSRCFPEGNIVDRPLGQPPILSHELIDQLEASERWESLWITAFALSILKSFRDDTEANKQVGILLDQLKDSSTLSHILAHPNLDTPFEILHACLSSGRSELFEIIRRSAECSAAFSRLHRSAALFVDNIDEYLIAYTNSGLAGRSDIHRKQIRMWHAGQIGAWSALRRLNGVNPHVKIFISIRKEAYHYAKKVDPSFANLTEFSRELRYTHSDIVSIITKNIAAEQVDRLSERTADDPIIRFIGTQNQFVSNSGTGKQETILDYWLRHCTLRPRDAVAIGGRISRIPLSRRSPSTIRAAINEAAGERVSALFAEVLPFFDDLYPDMLPRVITKNVLSADEIIAATAKYTMLVENEYGAATNERHPFCALYAIGLIGVVHDDRDKPGRLLQSFAEVGEVPFGNIHVLPSAERYLLHPSLSDYIVERNVSFIRSLNRHNVVGDGLEWRTEEEIRFVLVGDMRGYRSKVMNDVTAAQTFENFWIAAFKQFTRELDFAEASQGDSVVLADRSALRVIRACRGLAAALMNSGYQLQLRFGGHSGHWRVHNRDGVAHPEITSILGVAARLEPLAKPGHILVTGKFVENARYAGGDIGAESPSADYFPKDRFDDDGLLISKPTEPPERHAVYLLPEHAKPGS